MLHYILFQTYLIIPSDQSMQLLIGLLFGTSFVLEIERHYLVNFIFLWIIVELF